MDNTITVNGEPVKKYLDNVLGNEINSNLKNQVIDLSKSVHKPIVTKNRLKYQSLSKGGKIKQYSDDEIRDLCGFMAKPKKHKVITKNIIEVLKVVNEMTILDLIKVLKENKISVRTAVYRLVKNLKGIIEIKNGLCVLCNKDLTCKEIYDMYTIKRKRVSKNTKIIKQINKSTKLEDNIIENVIENVIENFN